jgi:hypothetical protein
MKEILGSSSVLAKQPVSATAVPVKPRRKTLRCPECGTKDDFPASVTREDVPEDCLVCQFHFNHTPGHDLRCAFCIAHLWQARLRALRILLFHPLSAWDVR